MLRHTSCTGLLLMALATTPAAAQEYHARVSGQTTGPADPAYAAMLDSIEAVTGLHVLPSMTIPRKVMRLRLEFLGVPPDSASGKSPFPPDTAGTTDAGLATALEAATLAYRNAGAREKVKQVEVILMPPGGSSVRTYRFDSKALKPLK